MIVSAPHLVFALLLSAFLSVDAAAYGSSECVPQEIPNMTIDISNAVSRGARFTDPVKAASIEECISACCSKLNSLGDRTCNLAVYDTRSSNPVQNCYLFYCPELRSCPMTPALEVMSFSFWTEKEESNSDSTKEDLKAIPKSKSTGKVQNTSGKKSSQAVQETVSGEPEIKEVLSRHDSVKQSSPSDVHSHTKISESKPLTKEDKADTPDRITSKLLHLANDIDKQLEKIEASSREEKYPESVKLSDPDVEPTIISRNKDSKKYSSDTKDTKSSNKKRPEIIKVHYTTPELTTLAPSVRTSQQTSTTTLRPILNTKNTVIPSPAPSKESKVTKQAPSSDTKSTKVLLSYNSTKTSNTATTMKKLPAAPLLLTTQVPTTVTVHQAKTMLPLTQPNSIRTSPLKAAKSTLNDGDHPNTSKNKQETDRSVAKLTSLEQQALSPPPGDAKDAAQNLDSIPGDSDKSGLVAALVFGVMFLVLVIGLVSHKVSEARRRHQYTKLDYLINGMYVDT